METKKSTAAEVRKNESEMKHWLRKIASDRFIIPRAYEEAKLMLRKVPATDVVTILEEKFRLSLSPEDDGWESHSFASCPDGCYYCRYLANNFVQAVEKWNARYKEDYCVDVPDYESGLKRELDFWLDGVALMRVKPIIIYGWAKDLVMKPVEKSERKKVLKFVADYDLLA